MDFISILLIAIGLSADSCAVSVSCGILEKKIVFNKAVKIAIILAIFQSSFTFLGWLFGATIHKFIRDFDHWIAFGLLTFIGVKMILEGWKNTTKKQEIINNKLIITIAIATSIDALIVGISFAMIQIKILMACFIIAATTFFFSMLGIIIGKKTGASINKQMEIVGGIILILIGIKILFEHLFIQ